MSLLARSAGHSFLDFRKRGPDRHFPTEDFEGRRDRGLLGLCSV